MLNELENIKDKIRKMLALSKSSNENEAAAALEMANKLIDKYRINETELYIESLMIKSTKTYVPWRTIIANAVSWLYGCHHYRNQDMGVFIFTGGVLYASLCGEMYGYLINTIERCSKKSIRKNAKPKFRRDFKYGMASRLYDRIMELGKACSWAPLREIRIEEARELVKKSVPLSEEKNKKIRLDRRAVIRGALYANNVSLARQACHTHVPLLSE